MKPMIIDTSCFCQGWDSPCLPSPGMWFACHQSHHQVQRASRNGPALKDTQMVDQYGCCPFWQSNIVSKSRAVDNWKPQTAAERSSANGFVWIQDPTIPVIVSYQLSWFIIVFPYIPYLNATLVCSGFAVFYWLKDTIGSHCAFETAQVDTKMAHWMANRDDHHRSAGYIKMIPSRKPL